MTDPAKGLFPLLNYLPIWGTESFKICFLYFILGGHVALGGDGLHTLQNTVSDQGLDLYHHNDFFLS